MRNFMRRTAAVRALAAITAAFLLFSSAVWAAGPELLGSLRANGVVVANSIPMPDGGTVRSGDSITTGQASLAIITSTGIGRLEIRANSQARLASDSVRLDRGSVASSRLAVGAGRFTARPETPGAAWFAVANRDGQVLVAAHRGNVIISAPGLPQVVVPEGSVAVQDQSRQDEAPPQNKPGQQHEQPQDQSATATQAPTQQPASAQIGNKNRKRKGAGSAAAGAPAVGWTIGSLSHAASIALIAGIGAAAAGTTAAVAMAASDSGPSPSH